MTDLEKAWDDYPAGAPPVAAILEQGRARQARNTVGARLRKPLTAVAAAAALVTAFAAGSIVGLPSLDTGHFDDNGGAVLTPPRDQFDSGFKPAAFQADLNPAATCDELLESYQERALARVTAWGWGGGALFRSPMAVADTLTTNALSVDKQATSGDFSQPSSPSGTNVQEIEVDEPDTVKLTGDLLLRMSGSELTIYHTAGQQLVKETTMELARISRPQLLVRGTTVVAVGADLDSATDSFGVRRGTRVITLDISNASHPKLVANVTYDAAVLSVRQHGSVVRMVLSSGLPDLDFRTPEQGETSRWALQNNRRAIKATTIDDWLPRVDVGHGAQTLLDCANVAIPPKTPALDTVSVIGFEVDEPTQPHAIGLAGAASIAYESADRLYLADSPHQWFCVNCARKDRRNPGKTNLYEFALDGADAVHVASGQVKGVIADRWSMNETNGVLRVAVGPWWGPHQRANSVVTLQRQGQRLQQLGRIDDLGKNQEIKSVRWLGDLAIVVTFRQVDPLYTIDLANPRQPQLMGELKIPGYSDYLHPLDADTILGMGYKGRGNKRGAQAAVFDISDLTDVKQAWVEHFVGREAVAAWEPKAFTWLPDQQRALTVLQQGRKAAILQVSIGEAEPASKVTQLPGNTNGNRVRTIGLPDGRVVLITDDSATFFTD